MGGEADRATDIQAEWIWCHGEERPKNFYLHVRKSFMVSGAIERGSIRVTADSRYRLFVNGDPVARGPARSDRRWQCLDRWDITRSLRPGKNVIAALVHHYGEWTFSYMLGRAGFLADVEIGRTDGPVIRFGTDGSWRVRPAQAWEQNLPRMCVQLGYPEVYDARHEIEGWNEIGYDDGAWEQASVLGPAGMEPWPHCIPREIPAMMERPLFAERVIDTGEVGPSISAGSAGEPMLPSVIMGREERFPNRGVRTENLDGLIVSGIPALVHPGADHGRYAVIDFGKEVTGYPVIEIDRALGGEIIDLGYGEVLETPAGEILRPGSEKHGIVNPDRADVHYADRYICKPGRQQFQTFDKRAFRYLQLDVRNVRQPLAVGPVSLLFSTYPVEDRGNFTCSDTLLNRIWGVGRWTVQLNMEDAYTDCPWRERGQWWGDVRVQALVNYYTFGDLALVKQGLRQIAQSQSEDGLTMGIYPTDWSKGILPTFTLLWIISLKDYLDFSGDSVLVAELFPSVERAIAYFERFRSEHDLLREVPFWLFVDWAEVETGGESAAVNALYYGGLRAASELAVAIGERDKGTKYRAFAARIRSGMQNVLWDAQGHCLRDAWKESELSPKISEQANCWGVAFGALPDETADLVLESLFDSRKATVRSTTPYFGFYVLSAMSKGGRHEQALKYIRQQWGKLLDWGATTWWEHWEPKDSFCHGWSSGPTYFLQAEILGVKPGEPGWSKILIEPHPGGLDWARGEVPTPRGTIFIEWKTGDVFSLEVDIPAEATVILPLMKEGHVSVTDREEKLPKKKYDRLADNARDATVVLHEAGTYRIRSK